MKFRNLTTFFSINLLLFSLVSSECSAQVKTQKVGMGLRYIVGDDYFFSPNLVYNRKLNDFFSASSRMGLIHNKREIPYCNSFLSRTDQRLMFDFDLQFTVLKYKKNSLRVGVGPSAWYKREIRPVMKSEFEDYIKKFSTIFFCLDSSAFDYSKENKVNLGYNLSSELELSVSKSYSLLVNFDVIKINKVGLDSYDGFVPSLGLTGLYTLK